MRKKLLFIGLIIALIALLIYVDKNGNRPLDWSKTFAIFDDKPYGMKVAFGTASSIADNQILFINNSLYTEKYNPEFQILYNSCYVAISQSIDYDVHSLKVLMDWVSKGNTALIVAEYIPHKIIDTLKLAVESKIDVNFKKELNLNPKTQDFNFINPNLINKINYKKEYSYYSIFFKDRDSINQSVALAGYSDKESLVIIKKFGKGKFILSSTPISYTNYYCWKYPENIDYIVKMFNIAYTGEKFVWDRHITENYTESESPLRYFLSNPNSRIGVYFALIIILLFILFKMKRMQRRIPIILPPSNQTVDFVRTIADLYYRKKNHRNLGDKKIRHLLEFIRNRYNMMTNKIDKDFLDNLILKSGCESDYINNLFKTISDFQKTSINTQEELIELNKVIDEFYIKVDHGKYKQ